MKIDFITLHAVKNYGSALQAYATQELLKKHNCDVRVINYIREDAKDENLFNTWCGNNIIKRLIMFPTIRRWKKVFGYFNRNYLNLTNEIYTTDEDFKKYNCDEIDAFCTGSDQVWNSVWNKGIIKPLYLDFIPDDKYRFSLSASFGQSKISKEEVLLTKEMIFKYNRISVRESTGVEILAKQYGYNNAVHLIDPTLNISGEEWRKLANNTKNKQKYILIYNLNRSKEFDEYAKQLSKKTGLKLVRLCTRYDQIFRIGKSVLIPNILDFIKLIDNATYVLTDSFHATAFSMNLNTEPICIYPTEFGGRIKSFLELTESLDRHVKNYNDFEILKNKVDFKKVNRILNQERSKTNKYLEDVFTEIRSR